MQHFTVSDISQKFTLVKASWMRSNVRIKRLAKWTCVSYLSHVVHEIHLQCREWSVDESWLRFLLICVFFLSGYTIFWNEKQILTWNNDFTGNRMFTSKSALRLTCFCKSASCWFWFSNFSFCSCVHFIRSFRLEMFLSGVPCQKEKIGYFQIKLSVCSVKGSSGASLPWLCLGQSCLGFPPGWLVFSSAVSLPAPPWWLFLCSHGFESSALSSDPANTPAVEHTDPTPSGPTDPSTLTET